MRVRSSASYAPNEYAASKLLNPWLHRPHSPASSSGNELRKGVRQLAQKYSAVSATGFARQVRHTGMRVASVRGLAQIRHSSGKMRATNSEKIFRANGGVSTDAVPENHLLLKIHPRLRYHSTTKSRARVCSLPGLQRS